MDSNKVATALSKILFVGIFIIIFSSGISFAQQAEIPFHLEPYSLNSGSYDGDQVAEEAAVLAYSQVVKVDKVPWLRLLFSNANLGNQSYLQLTSLKDGAQQRLYAKQLTQWRSSSVYFNGDAVRVDLYVAQGDKNVFVRMEEVMVGDWAMEPLIDSQCGPTDDRIPSNDPAAGRLMSIGCTSWIIGNGLMVSAGHCLDGSSGNVVEFNVPQSLPGGTVQHPPPEDQYSVDFSTKVFVNGGVGNDYGVFEVFDNSITGLQPINAQGAFFTVVQDLTPDSIRITGYGVDNGSANQTQQTHVGPNVGSSGTTMRYQTDTEGGNSGSPVIDEATGFAVGVHTHGGCTTAGTGSNKGTSTFHTAFWDAMGVPAGFAPSIPDSFVAYSDYTTPTSMSLTWNDPTTLVNGDTLNPGTYSINIKRDGVFLDSVAGGVETYTDTGLVDGIEYTYSIAAELDSSGFESDTVQATWIAGGSPFPNPPQNLIVAGTQNEVTLTWINPSDNIDGTPMDDFAGINLYQNGALVTTFARTSADTARRDTAVYTPSTPGFYEWHMTAIDNESPSNESDPTAIVGTPLSVPIADQFTDPGEPNVGIWINTTTDINDRAVNPPSPSYSLNLNGMPNGEDIIDLKPVDLSGMQGSGIVFSYYYQPQGTGNEPETGDSLRVYFKNDLNEWVLVRAYPGMPVQPFTEEVIDIETAPHGGGSYFHGQFQARFRSTGGAANIPNDDWFVDDVSLGPPVGIEEEKDRLPMQFAVMPNYPNPFNPTTTIEYQLPRASTVKLVIYNTLGQMVRTLVNQSMEAGVHQAVWDGRNERGKQVASGIYVYRFSAESADDKAGSFQQVNKMILLK